MAYGDAAAACLEYYASNQHDRAMKLSCLVAYYPTRMPVLRLARYPANIHVCIHLVAGSTVEHIVTPQMVGIQGKKTKRRYKVPRGLGPAGSLYDSPSRGVRCWAYAGVEPGFAQQDSDEYSAACAELAWTRSLATARRALCGNQSGRFDVDRVIDENMDARFVAADLDRTVATYTTDGHVTFTPTLSGGTGTVKIRQFYHDYFFDPLKPGERIPPTLRATLVSRTTGVGRIVDELHISLRHTHIIPWLLPCIPPTRKRIEFILVSILTLSGSAIAHEHVYWDQADVLVQAGLLDPRVVPRKVRQRLGEGVELPVRRDGGEAARRVLEGVDEDGFEGEADNVLIEGDDADETDDDDDDKQDKHGEHEEQQKEKDAMHDATPTIQKQSGDAGEHDQDNSSFAKTSTSKYRKPSVSQE